MKKIMSTQNHLVKLLASLRDKSKSRQEKNQFLIEGKREIDLSINGGYEIEKILVYEGLCKISDLKISKDIEIVEISKEIFEKLSYRKSFDGLLALANKKKHSLFNLRISDNPLILVVENIEKPGNLGAVLRTCDAAKIDAVLIADQGVDIYNSNVIRSSVGCIFTNQIGIGSSKEIFDYLQAKNVNIYAAVLQEKPSSYDSIDYNKPTAFVLGNEAEGLSSFWRNELTKKIIIPMQGEIDSMNISVSAAILIFEAKRQRGF